LLLKIDARHGEFPQQNRFFYCYAKSAKTL
jgi:hypothetical protein